MVVEELKFCRELGAKVISAHVDMGYYDSGRGNVETLRKLGLDITSNYAAEMFTQMRVVLADQRCGGGLWDASPLHSCNACRLADIRILMNKEKTH